MGCYSTRQTEILRLFCRLEHATAKDIANELKVSEKTIRNEIKEINRFSQEEIITPLKGRGFAIVSPEAVKKSIIDARGENTDRRLMLLKELLSVDEIDYYELADRYYISESTLDNDIQELNEDILCKYQAVIVRKNNRLYLNCREQVRRHIHTCLLMKEVEYHEFDLDMYDKYFVYSKADDLKKLLLDFARRNGLHFNDIELLTFLIHMGILIDSVKSGKSQDEFLTVGVEDERFYAEDLCCCIEKTYDLTLTEAERKYVALLLSARVGAQLAKEQRTSEMQNFISNILKEAAECYQIQLKDDENFKNNLLLHLLSLVDRARQGRQWKNPLGREIKEKFPFLYDISVFIVAGLQKQFHIILNEDEIGFITLHLMCLVEKMSKESFRIAVVDPMSCRSSSWYQERLEFCFPNEIMEVKCFSAFEPEQVKRFQPFFVLMTAPMKTDFEVPVLICSPLLAAPDIQKIAKCMEKVKNSQIRKEMMRLQFDSRLFFFEPQAESKEELIHFMCSRLVEYGYCDEKYEELVLERERIAPTSFGGLFAIPHPVKKEAFEPGVAIAVLKKPMDWSGQKVCLVFLFSLPKGNENLMKLYGGIVEMLDDEKVKKLFQKKTYKDFVEEFLKG